MESLFEHTLKWKPEDFERQMKINAIISEPWHGIEFYDPLMLNDLHRLLIELYTFFKNAEYQISDPITLVNNYVKSNIKVRASYFDCLNGEVDTFPESELFYRTGYAALTRHEAMCAGFAESTRLLLALFNIESYTLLAKLPGANKQLLHYLVIDVDDNNEFRILDPERQANCERKGYDFQKYLDQMTFILPDEHFAQNKVGKTGVGEKAMDFLQRETTIKANGITGAYELAKVMKERGYQRCINK